MSIRLLTASVLGTVVVDQGAKQVVRSRPEFDPDHPSRESVLVHFGGRAALVHAEHHVDDPHDPVNIKATAVGLHAVSGAAIGAGLWQFSGRSRLGAIAGGAFAGAQLSNTGEAALRKKATDEFYTPPIPVVYNTADVVLYAAPVVGLAAVARNLLRIAKANRGFH